MDTLEKLIQSITPPDQAAVAAARARQDTLTKPLGSLGRLEALSVQIAGITGRARPLLLHKLLITMAADHGVARDGVSLYPAAVTRQMVLNFLTGGAAINVLARHVGARVTVVDMGVSGGFEEMPGLLRRPVAGGTASLLQGPAMSREQALQAVTSGAEIVTAELKNGLDIVGTGDMGIGNTTASSAITAVVTGVPVVAVTGRGTGLDDAGFKHKVTVIEQALALNQPDARDGLDVLAKVGGFEIGGLAGVMLGAAAAHVPVVIDGFISGAAALIACTLAPALRDYLIPAHLSVEKGHRAVLHHLGLVPLLEMDLRLGEGTGAALGIGLAEAAVKILNEMATFGEAGVSEAGDA